MNCFSAAFLFLLLKFLHCNLEVEAIDYRGILDDIDAFNVTCEKEYCANSTADSLKVQSCHCNIQCVRLGTCCIDSNYADIPQPKFKPACRLVNKIDYFFMVDQCSSSDSAWANLCNSEWDGEVDLQKIVPVTSLNTTITYKNYYCFRCHEATDKYFYWTVALESTSAKYSSSEVADKRVLLTYDNETKTWMASYDGGDTSFDIQLSVRAPIENDRIIYNCYPNVISDCASNWTDDDVKTKCHSYMGIKLVRNNDKGIYKNIHCALCNYENLDDIYCRYFIKSVWRWTFSFTHLLDINRSDGELVGKIQKCSEDQLWDPYVQKCRKLTCALPGYKVKNGKCVQE